LDCLFMREAGEGGDHLHQLRMEQQAKLNQFSVPA